MAVDSCSHVSASLNYKRVSINISTVLHSPRSAADLVLVQPQRHVHVHNPHFCEVLLLLCLFVLENYSHIIQNKYMYRMSHHTLQKY